MYIEESPNSSDINKLPLEVQKMIASFLENDPKALLNLGLTNHHWRDDVVSNFYKEPVINGLHKLEHQKFNAFQAFFKLKRWQQIILFTGILIGEIGSCIMGPLLLWHFWSIPDGDTKADNIFGQILCDFFLVGLSCIVFNYGLIAGLKMINFLINDARERKHENRLNFQFFAPSNQISAERDIEEQKLQTEESDKQFEEGEKEKEGKPLNRPQHFYGTIP